MSIRFREHEVRAKLHEILILVDYLSYVEGAENPKM